MDQSKKVQLSSKTPFFMTTTENTQKAKTNMRKPRAGSSSYLDAYLWGSYQPSEPRLT